METMQFNVTGMSCGHCEAAVREEVSQLDGVERVDVSADTGTLTVTSSTPIDHEFVIAAVDEAGYQALAT